MGRREAYNRRSAPLESLAREYDAQASEILHGPDGPAVSEEISGFAIGIASAREGSEQNDQIERLLNRLKLRKPGIFKNIDEDPRERLAFTLSLVGTYQRSLQ